MAMFHNVQDLQVIQILRQERDQIRELLQKRFPAYYDPTESLPDILSFVLKDVDKMLSWAARVKEIVAE
jgi:hypothetical protein